MNGRLTIRAALATALALGPAPFVGCGRTGEPPPQPAPAQVAAAPEAPLTMRDVAAAYDAVHDYTALYEKEELSISNGEKQTIRIAFRKPLSIRLDWLDDDGKVDQSAVYRKGANDDKVLARSNSGLGRLAGTMHLSVDDPLAQQDSSHPITEAGLGPLVAHIADDASKPDVTTTFRGEEPVDGTAAFAFELSAHRELGGVAKAERCRVWIDQHLRLPIQVELYDAKSRLLERHRFRDLRVNTGVTDKTFSL